MPHSILFNIVAPSNVENMSVMRLHSLLMANFRSEEPTIIRTPQNVLNGPQAEDYVYNDGEVITVYPGAHYDIPSGSQVLACRMDPGGWVRVVRFITSAPEEKGEKKTVADIESELLVTENRRHKIADMMRAVQTTETRLRPVGYSRETGSTLVAGPSVSRTFYTRFCEALKSYMANGQRLDSPCPLGHYIHALVGCNSAALGVKASNVRNVYACHGISFTDCNIEAIDKCYIPILRNSNVIRMEGSYVRVTDRVQISSSTQSTLDNATNCRVVGDIYSYVVTAKDKKKTIQLEDLYEFHQDDGNQPRFIGNVLSPV